MLKISRLQFPIFTMEYHHSHLVDPSSYDDRELLAGLPLRVSHHSELELAGVARLRRDWKTYVGPLPADTTGATLGSVYCWTSVTIPECLPERLELLSYVTEYAFLHDDMVDAAGDLEVSQHVKFNAFPRELLTIILKTES